MQGALLDRTIKGGPLGGLHWSKDLNDGKEPLYEGLGKSIPGKGKQYMHRP